MDRGPGRRCFVLCLVFSATLAARPSGVGQQPSSDPAEAVGRALPGRSPMAFVQVDGADRRAVQDCAERFWTVVLRNAAMNPPMGFNLKPSMVAHGYVRPGAGPGAPYSWTTGGYIYWYYNPRPGVLDILPVAMEAFWIHANRLSVAISGGGRWDKDADGDMFQEPLEIRRIGGFPQYDNGVVVISDGRPAWTPVPRERLLRWEIGKARENLEGVNARVRAATERDPEGDLERWLRDRPKRQRDMARAVEDLKRTDPATAEKMRVNAAKTEEQVEKNLRDLIPVVKTEAERTSSRAVVERKEAEACIAYLDSELARLSPAERAAPGYMSYDEHPPRIGCSRVVDARATRARGIVEPNRAFYDRRLPRTAVQVIMVDFSNFESAAFARTGYKRRAYEGLRDGMDYQALAAMLARR